MTYPRLRAIYQTAELSEGWNGRIISNELYFSKLDMIPLLFFIAAAAEVQP